MPIAKSWRHTGEHVTPFAWRATLLALVTIALLVGMFKAPWRGESATHDAREMLAAEVAAGHSHDDDTGIDTGTESVSGHVHGHDASDHQHDVMHLPPVVHTMRCRLDYGWRAAHVPQRLPGSPWQIERPPRQHTPLA